MCNSRRTWPASQAHLWSTTSSASVCTSATASQVSNVFVLHAGCGCLRTRTANAGCTRRCPCAYCSLLLRSQACRLSLRLKSGSQQERQCLSGCMLCRRLWTGGVMCAARCGRVPHAAHHQGAQGPGDQAQGELQALALPYLCMLAASAACRTCIKPHAERASRHDL